MTDIIEEDGFRGWDYAEVWEYVKDKSIENKNSVFQNIDNLRKLTSPL